MRLALGAGARAVGAVAALRADGRALDDARSGRAALAILNGAHGDLVQREAPGLALGMTVRVGGRPVPVEPYDLARAFPDATGRLAVFLHGLTESEHSWGYRAEQHYGRPGVTYGTRLREDLGLTPVCLRYNTGLHISDNGRSLAGLLAALVDAWPVPVQDVVLIGHSMGGLVARSALHQAGGGTAEAHGWTHLVRDSVTLGSPHLGAPLERGVHRLAAALTRLPETRGLATLLALRSVGIKDLRRGTLVEADWSGRDLDALGPAEHTHVPLHDGARHFVVLATMVRDPGGLGRGPRRRPDGVAAQRLGRHGRRRPARLPARPRAAARRDAPLRSAQPSEGLPADPPVVGGAARRSTTGRPRVGESDQASCGRTA